MTRQLREFPQVEPGEEAVLVQVDEGLAGHLPVGLPQPPLDAQPGSLVLSEGERFGPALAPGAEEILREVGVILRYNILPPEISSQCGVPELLVGPSESNISFGNKISSSSDLKT